MLRPPRTLRSTVHHSVPSQSRADPSRVGERGDEGAAPSHSQPTKHTKRAMVRGISASRRGARHVARCGTGAAVREEWRPLRHCPAAALSTACGSSAASARSKNQDACHASSLSPSIRYHAGASPAAAASG
eukprot:7385573-Prymnesium_polylepis.1